ncbi:DUF262 domain-containing protein [Hydrogenophaga sp.]|uniref:DUF262 domain-containing protein n=1 Tax=Hydrogenophaga sp. TaxID=1904254 RepID=UPI0027307C3E|nr:DUF262 domain-containing protein [Hydrogenophaga sp.]MDP2075156.1 DUF262 domain-containing protein [Hydrogenophaga sp.]MDP3108407.1 DUF262 domain-containing protein [Hydrogenophaga sp.]
MSRARQHSFATLFSVVDVVEIPIIQRDYAQGRKQSADVLDAFLASLRGALHSEPGKSLDLDFIYGTFEDDGGKVLSLLDGQQRLTTLFLLHWYVAVCEGQLEDFRSRWTKRGRSRFTYATRPSSLEFFDALANAVVHPPAGGGGWSDKLSAVLIDSNWFFLSWRSDPTVKACMTTLDAISSGFGITKGLYPRLIDEVRPPVTFHFLDLERFGLTDDLYIKMNARGKPLTPFENFKAWLVGRVANEPWAKGFDLALDQKWMDLFWRLVPKENSMALASAVDDLYLRFMYVMAFFDACIRLERGYSAPRTAIDWVQKLRQARGYIPLRELEAQGSFSTSAVEVASVVLNHLSGPASASDINTLERALAPTSDYADLVRLFSIVAWVTSDAAKSNRPTLEADRSRWDRVISNLIANHRIDEVYTASTTLRGVQALVQHAGGLYDALSEADAIPGFGMEQAKEEIRKASLIVEDPTRESLFTEAESHPYLQGRIGFILDFSNAPELPFDREAFVRYSQRARAVLDEGIRASPDHLLERAMLSIEDYLVERGGSKFSFCNAVGGTYRERSENWFRVIGRPAFKTLLDGVNGDARSSLHALIGSATCTDWRRYVIAEPRLIAYCKERLIHRGSLDDIYLMSRKRLSGYHVELRSYALHWALQARPKDVLPGLRYRYVETYDETQPGLIFQIDAQDLRVAYEAGSWSCSGPSGQVPFPVELVEFMESRGFTERKA